MASSSHDPVQRPLGPPSAPDVGPTQTGEYPPQHRCQKVPARWSRFHLARQQQQPSQPFCNIDQQWRHRHHQQQQSLFGMGHYGWVISKWSRGRPSFPRRRFSCSHRESTPIVANDLPEPRGAQNGSILNIVADPMSAGLLSGSSQRSEWTNRTPYSQPDEAVVLALRCTRQRWRSRTVTASIILAMSD